MFMWLVTARSVLVSTSLRHDLSWNRCVASHQVRYLSDEAILTHHCRHHDAERFAGDRSNRGSA